MNTLSETVAMRHPVDCEVFDGDQIISVGDAPAMLVGEVPAPPGDALMHARHRMPMFGSLRRPLLQFAVGALDLGKRLLLGAEETRVGDLLARREGGKRLQAHVNAHLSPSL